MNHGGIFVWVGADRPRKVQRVQALERSLGIHTLDRHQLDGAVVTPTTLLALCRQQPATSPIRLIVVDQAHRLDRVSVDGLLQHAQTIRTMACVILFLDTDVPARHPLAQVVGRGTAPTSSQVVVEEFKERDVPAAKPFAFTDALGQRNIGGALSAASDQLLAGKEPLELLGLVAWQLNRWVMVRRLANLGYSTAKMEAVTGLRGWQVQRLQSEVSGRSTGELDHLLTRCWQLDVDAKQGRTLPQLAIEQLVMEVCVTDVTTSPRAGGSSGS